jgi:hypothetical protein
MPNGRRWSSGSRSANTAAPSGCRGACSNTYCPSGPTPERCVEAYYLQRARFESIAERKLRRRQLTEDGNVEISGRDVREGSAPRALR